MSTVSIIYPAPELPENYDDLVAQLNTMYRVSEAIPATGIPDELQALLDWMHQQLLSAEFDLYDLLDIEYMNRDALILTVRERGIPVPDFATTLQIRNLARYAGYINSYRNTAIGWQTYLDIVAPTSIQVTVTSNAIRNLSFIPGIEGRMFPGVTELQTAGTNTDLVPYLLGPLFFENDVLVVIKAVGAPTPNQPYAVPGFPGVNFADFVQQTASYFVPVIDDETTISVILE